jgi:hypothetical protein
MLKEQKQKEFLKRKVWNIDLRSELGNTVGGQSLEKMNSLPIFPDITRPVVERTAETGGGKEKS